jgi:integrase/recombinase XerC
MGLAGAKTPARIAARSIGLREAQTLYLQFNRHLAPATRKIYKEHLNHFFESLAVTTVTIDTIDPLDVLNYLNHTQAAGNKPATYNVKLVALKSFFRWAAQYCEIPDYTKSLKQLKTGQQKQRVLTDAEFDKIRSADGQTRDICVFLANTGLRIAEFCNLQKSNYDLNRRLLTVCGKGSKVREIPLNKTALEILLKYNGDIHLLKSKRLDRWKIRYLFDKFAAKIGIAHFNPHALRHYFITKLLDRGAKIEKVAILAGHSKIETTFRYFHISDSLSSLTCLLDDI